MFDFFEDQKVSRIFDLVIVFLLLVVIGFDVFYLEKEYQDDKVKSYVTEIDSNDIAINEKEFISEKIENVEPVLKMFRVDIKGAVKNPGVYELVEGSIINNVIELAGGLKSTANTKYLNLSKKITDEMVINVFTSSEIKKMTEEEVKVIVEECICDTEETIQCDGSSIIEVGDKTEDNNEVNNNDSSKENIDLENNTKININTASLEELMTLSGVGEAKAKAIIEYRNTSGGFKTLEEIKNVSGIGDAAYNKIKDNITI